MTVDVDPNVSAVIPGRSRVWAVVDSLPGARVLKNQRIGLRLLVGFAVMVLLTFLVGGIGYFGSVAATQGIDSTIRFRFPASIVSSRAQANLLKMLGDVRGYLALGQGEFLDSYEQSRQAFERDLTALQNLSANLSEDNRARLVELQRTFEQWSALPAKLFELRDDQLEREPAYKLLATDVSRLAGQALISTNSLIEAQAQREPTPENMKLLGDMANFQGTFASMFSAMRGYVTTRNRIFRQEYEVNETINEFAWQRLTGQRDHLTENQQLQLDDIAKNRDQFLKQPDEVFKLLESDRWREDLYLFTAEAIPLTEKMQQLLAEMNQSQQDLLLSELNQGRSDLFNANRLTLATGLIALAFGIVLTFVFRENIAGPVVRLTGVADRIRNGDLDTQAAIEATDEIGILAHTFNNMTTKLRSTLFQVTKEKKRADDLLNVVIPIGVELSSEKDFNRLLENMLVQAKRFCHARAGILYLRRNGELQYEIIRNTAQGIMLGGTSPQKPNLPTLAIYDAQHNPVERNVVVHVALTGQSVNIADAASVTDFDLTGPPELLMDATAGKYAVSQLNLPLKNIAGNVLGVLQLLDAQDVEQNRVIPFDKNIQQMMESFSSLAAAALEAYIREQALRHEIRQLRIEIDETKRQQQVSEITGTDFFSDLQARAQEIRQRSRRPKSNEPENPA